MSAKQYTISELEQIIALIAKKYGIAKIFLFDSFARGNYSENSDIDFRIEKGEMKGISHCVNSIRRYLRLCR